MNGRNADLCDRFTVSGASGIASQRTDRERALFRKENGERKRHEEVSRNVCSGIAVRVLHGTCCMRGVVELGRGFWRAQIQRFDIRKRVCIECEQRQRLDKRLYQRLRR